MLCVDFSVGSPANGSDDEVGKVCRMANERLSDRLAIVNVNKTAGDPYRSCRCGANRTSRLSVISLAIWKKTENETTISS